MTQRRRRRRRDRRRLLRARCAEAQGRRRRGDAARATTERRPGAHARPHDPHRPVRRPLRRGARRAHARSRSRTQPHGIDLGPMVPRVREVARARRRAASSSRPPYITRRPPAPRGRGSTATADGLVLVSRRHLRSNNSWMHNVTVLVKGKDRCTLLDPSRRRRARRRRRRRARARQLRGRQRRGAGRGERRDDAGRRVAAPRLGSRQGRHPAVGRPRARRREQQPARARRHLVDVLSGNAAVNGIPVEVAPVSR